MRAASILLYTLPSMGPIVIGLYSSGRSAVAVFGYEIVTLSWVMPFGGYPVASQRLK